MKCSNATHSRKQLPELGKQLLESWPGTANPSQDVTWHQQLLKIYKTMLIPGLITYPEVILDREESTASFLIGIKNDINVWKVQFCTFHYVSMESLTSIETEHFKNTKWLFLCLGSYYIKWKWLSSYITNQKKVPLWLSVICEPSHCLKMFLI